jgi:5,5'-dehydrodivanillate O-demethylase
LFDVLRMQDGTKYVQVNEVHCNWFNHVENIVDVSHLAWLHGYTFPAYGGRKVTYHWERTSFGANNVMRVEGIDDTHVSCYGYPTVNRFTSPPFKKGGALIRSMIFRVPVDDASTLLYFIRFAPDGDPGIKTSRREQKYGEYTQLATDWWGIDVNDQDRMAVEQQGVIADRPNEHLGVSDGGIIAMRQMMRESLAAVAAGKDPLCIIRDPAGQKVDFPVQATMTEQTQDDVGYARGYGEAAETYAEAGE